MLGAVIADMAAWTMEHDKECFFRQLVSPRAKLSGYGWLLLAMRKTVQSDGLIVKHRFYMEIGKALAHADALCVDLPLEWRRWGLSEYDSPIPFDLKIALIISAFINSGYLSENRQEHLGWKHFFHGGKQEYYARSIMTVLRRLHNGATKDEAIEEIPKPFFDYYASGCGHSWKDLLEYTTFAWRCFYHSWDFTSALHNASKCTGNRRLAMILAGTFAEAMYGYWYSMTKKQYGGNYNEITCPDSLNEEIQKQFYDIRFSEDIHRIFFPKNNALTNVEHHVWTNVDNPYANIVISPEMRSRMMYAFHTGWEARYGIYLDNGWFYVYRSHCLLLRFQLKEMADGTWRIYQFQISNDPHANVEDFQNVLNVITRTPYF